MNNSVNRWDKKINNPVNKWERDLDSSPENKDGKYKHLKRRSTSFVLRVMQIKTTVRY